MNYQILLKKASKELKSISVSNPILDSEILLSNALKISREKMLLNLNKKITQSEIDKFNKLLIKRKKKEPIAYIFGSKEFWKTTFVINQSVLIPRPETELLVEQSLKYLKKNRDYKVLDIGTGSGCILISILKERTKCKGIGIDFSKEAIKVAKINAKMQQLENRIKFVYSDVDKFLSNKYDLVVSNPPYIKKCEITKLDGDVKNYEPFVALNGGSDGLLETRRVIKASSRLLKNRGKLILEIGYDQLQEIKKMLEYNKFYINNVSRDLAGRNRCVTSTKI